MTSTSARSLVPPSPLPETNTDEDPMSLLLEAAESSTGVNESGAETQTAGSSSKFGNKRPRRSQHHQHQHHQHHQHQHQHHQPQEKTTTRSSNKKMKPQELQPSAVAVGTETAGQSVLNRDLQEEEEEECAEAIAVTSEGQEEIEASGKRPVDTAGSTASGEKEAQEGDASTTTVTTTTTTNSTNTSSSSSEPKRTARGQRWAPAEDEALRQAVAEFKGKNWKQIASRLKNRTDVQCLHRWHKVIRPGLVKGGWTAEEDLRLVEAVKQLGHSNWSVVAEHMPGRVGKSCRERYFNHLGPGVSKEPWSPEEDRLIMELHAQLGTKWSIIAQSLPGRSDNAIKNRFNSTLRRVLKDGPEVKTRNKREGTDAAAAAPAASSSTAHSRKKGQNPTGNSSETGATVAVATPSASSIITEVTQPEPLILVGGKGENGVGTALTQATAVHLPGLLPPPPPPPPSGDILPPSNSAAALSWEVSMKDQEDRSSNTSQESHSREHLLGQQQQQQEEEQTGIMV